MPKKRDPTAAEWAVIRARWQGAPDRSDATDLKWLVHEVRDALSIDISPRTIRLRAAADGWEKGGSPSVRLEPRPGIKAARRRRPGGRLSGTKLDLGLLRPIPVVPGVRVEEDAPTGAQTHYRREFAAMMDQFFDLQPFTQSASISADGRMTVQLVPTTFPTFERFAVGIGVNPSTLRKWEKALKPDGSPRHPEFVVARARAKSMQVALLLENGLLGLYDGAATMSTLRKLAGWTDQPAVASKVSQVTTENLDAMFDAALKRVKERAASLHELRSQALRRGSGVT